MEQANVPPVPGSPWRGWRQLQDFTGFSPPTLRKLASDNGLPLYRIGGSVCLDPADWIRFMEQSRGTGK